MSLEVERRADRLNESAMAFGHAFGIKGQRWARMRPPDNNK